MFEPGAPIVVHHRKPWRAGRPVRLRGWVDYFDGDLLVVRRRFNGPGLAYDGLMGARQQPGDVGELLLRAGAWISARRYRRADGRLIGDLYNVQTPTELAPGEASYVDLEIDVARVGRRVEVQDRARLDAAEAAGHIPAELARVARELAGELAERLRGDRGEVEWDLRPADPPAWDDLTRRRA